MPERDSLALLLFPGRALLPRGSLSQSRNTFFRKIHKHIDQGDDTCISERLNI